MNAPLRYLLLQVRNPDDRMRKQELACFARVLSCPIDRIQPWDLLTSTPIPLDLERFDMVLLGGSGHYSATSQQPWIDPVLDCLRDIHQRSKPTFASCWGFQAMARALGGQVIHDLEKAELGTHVLKLSAAGGVDPIFAPLGTNFSGQMGHEDRVVQLPPDAVLLASTNLVDNQAYRFKDKPIYCTQFHPELNRDDLMGRLRHYPEYVQRIRGITLEEFAESLCDTPETERILPRFVAHVFGS